MISIVKPFDSSKDVCEVDQFGYLDLRKAMIDGVVKGDLVVDESSYNDIDDPRAIVGRPLDQFDAMEKGISLLKGVAAAEAASSSTDNAD